MSQPDIHDPNPYSTQSYNRYSYAMNNPLKYVDPSGYTSRMAAHNNWMRALEMRAHREFQESSAQAERERSICFMNFHRWATKTQARFTFISVLGVLKAEKTPLAKEQDLLEIRKKEAAEIPNGAGGFPHGGIMFYKENGEPLRVTGRGDVNIIYTVKDVNVASFLSEYNNNNNMMVPDVYYSRLADKYGNDSYNVTVDGTSVSGYINVSFKMYALMTVTMMVEGYAAGRTGGLNHSAFPKQSINYGMVNYWNNYLNVPRQFQPWW